MALDNFGARYLHSVTGGERQSIQFSQSTTSCKLVEGHRSGRLVSRRMNTNYRVGDSVPVLGACGHELTVEHVIAPGTRKPDDARDIARYYSLLCFHPSCGCRIRMARRQRHPERAEPLNAGA